MMRADIFVVCVFLVAVFGDVVFGAPKCSVISCVHAGEAPVVGNITNFCVDSFSSSTGNVCVNLKPVGTTCSESRECADSGVCFEGRCRNRFFRTVSPGERCYSDDDCEVFGIATMGLCKDGRCSGLAQGQPCNTSTNFGCINSFCNETSYGTCTPFGGQDSQCSNISPCASLFYCVNGKCQENEPAVTNCSVSVPCNLGNYCGVDKKCHPASLITNEKCANTSDCPNGLSCDCNAQTGASQCYADVESSAPAEKSDLVKCWSDNKCSSLNHNCFYSECSQQFCAYKSALVQNAPADIWYPTCFHDYLSQVRSSKTEIVPFFYCDTNTPMAEAGKYWIPALIVGVIAIPVGFWYFFIHVGKQQKYTSISS